MDYNNMMIQLTLTKSCVLNPLALSCSYSGWNHSNREWYIPKWISVLDRIAVANSPENKKNT